MHKRVVIALMLMLSVFVFVGCSSDDETEDSEADVGQKTTAFVEVTGPEWPQTVYIAAGMDELNGLAEVFESGLRTCVS